MFDFKDQEYWLLLNVSVGKIKIGLQANAGLHTYRQRNVYLSVGFSYLFDDPKPSTSTVILGDLIKQCNGFTREDFFLILVILKI